MSARGGVRGGASVVALGLVACGAMLAGCASPLAAFAGERAVGVDFAAAPAGGPGDPVRVPAVFTLHNTTWGGIRVESVRAPVGVEVSTVPPLPATIPGGGRLEVAVIASLRPGAVRTVLLECAGQPPLRLEVAADAARAAPATDLPAGATTK